MPQHHKKKSDELSPGVTITAAAKAIGVSRQRLTVLIKQGKISRRPDGKLDLAVVRREYATNLDPSKRRKPQKVKTSSEKSEGPDEELDFNRARTKRENANALRAELTYRRERGQLLERDVVKSREFEIARKVRDRILGWPARLQGFIPPDAMKTITDECETLIRELQSDVAGISEA